MRSGFPTRATKGSVDRFRHAMIDKVQELKRITIDAEVMGGKPCIRGMRVTVGMIVEAIAAERTVPELLADFPYLQEQDVREALSYAASLAQGRDVRLAS